MRRRAFRGSRRAERDLLHNADIAMYGAKHSGGNRYVFHPPVTAVQR